MSADQGAFRAGDVTLEIVDDDVEPREQFLCAVDGALAATLGDRLVAHRDELHALRLLLAKQAAQLHQVAVGRRGYA